MNICTIIAKNYIAYARVLSESFKKHHPDGTSFVLVIDEVEGYIDAEESFELITSAELNIDDYEHMAETYDVVELSTAVKPWLLSYLLNERGLERVAYFDPDIRIYDRLDQLNQLTREYELVLIPHVTSPMPRDGKKPSEADILIAGTYNLGFIALERGPRTNKLLDWWSERLKTDCVVAPELGYFVDQRWIDFIHGVMPDFYVLNDPSYNVAYWNLHGRELTNEKGRYYVNGEPLRFFHFSGFDPHHRNRLSMHQNRIELRRGSALARICDEYADALLEHGYDEVKDWPYTYGTLPNGVRLNPGMRQLYRAGIESGELKDSIFTLKGADRFVAWLNEPAPVGGGHGITRYLYEIYSRRADLRRAFPNLDGPDAARFVAWAQTHGNVELPVPHHPSVELNGHHTTDGSPTGINVAGYFRSELGVGEVARQMTTALETQNVPSATIGLFTENSRQGHHYETDRTEPIFPINLICVNADQLPRFVTQVGSQLFKDRYSIGMWWWEVSEFPERFAESFKHLNEVWVGSHHVADVIASVSPIPVVKMTLPISMSEIKEFDRPALGLPEGFVFLLVFDYHSVFERKNPLALVEAFKKAFPPGSGASLVLKSINGDQYPEKYESLFRAIEDHPDIYVIDRYVSPDEKNAMIAGCDCYVSLHRSEGFGITLAEAMYLEKPVIATAYSGNLDFMTQRNSYLVDYELRPVGQGYDPYPPTAEWADPDVEHATSLMRHVFEHREEARKRGRRAAAEIRRTHSPEAAGRAMARRLKYIETHLHTKPGTKAPPPTHEHRAEHAPYTPRPIGNTELLAEHIAHTPSPVATESLLGRIAGRVRRVVLRLIWPFAMQQRAVNDQLFTVIKNLDANLRELAQQQHTLNADLLGAADHGARLDALEALPAKVEALRAQMDDASVELKERGIEIEALHQVKGESNLEDSVSTRYTLYLGHLFVYPADSIIGKEFIAQGKEWEPVLRTLMSALLPTEEPIICEVGSNIGASLLQMLAAKPHARILAFEPSTRFLPFLERNLTLAGVRNVEVFPFFLGKEAGSVCLYNNATTASAVSENYDGHEPRGQQLTEVTTLDEVLCGRGQRVDFLKVDTDGYDFEVLRGAETILRRDRPILFFELATYLLPSDPTADLVWLQSLGYQRFACINPGTGRLIGVTGELDQVLAWSDTIDQGYCDVLVCHEVSHQDLYVLRKP